MGIMIFYYFGPRGWVPGGYTSSSAKTLIRGSGEVWGRCRRSLGFCGEPCLLQQQTNSPRLCWDGRIITLAT